MLKACFALNSRASGSRPVDVQPVETAAILAGWLMKTENNTLRNKAILFPQSLVDFFKRHLDNLPVYSDLYYLCGPLDIPVLVVSQGT